MTIQRLLFPEVDVCDQWEMYYRGVKQQGYEKEIKLSKGEVLSLETYFNGFSIGKWKKYTNLEQLSLLLNISGKVLIKGIHAVGSNKIVKDPLDNTKVKYYYGPTTRTETEIKVTPVEDGYQVNFEELYQEGTLFVTIEALEDVVLKGGAYVTKQEPINDVELALGICTFKREEFVTRNVNQVIEQVIQNPESPLYQHVEVYVSDNGQTLPQDSFNSDKVHLYPNKNLGGAGGFTRAMIESVLYRENSPFTHVILMDDDIVLDCNVLERNYKFLQYLKPEYQKAMIGGELFELDKRYLQFEAGAAFRGTVIQSYNQRWDMRKPEPVAANEIENPMNFNGWWYCCIPVSYIREDNLPIPVFIHRDDVEYGMRNEKEGTILINGICVWHPQGPNKAPVAMNYYDVRNDLIAMCDSPTRATPRQIKENITRACLGNMLRYRYQVIDCVFQGVYDYYAGPEKFMELDTVENHKSLAKYNYTFEAVPEDFDRSKIKREKAQSFKGHVFFRAALCWLLPAKNETRFSGYEDIGCAFRAKKICFIDEIRDEMITVEKSYKEAFRIFFEYCRIMRMISKEHEKVTARWVEKKPEYTSLSFWEKYLELKYK